MRHRSAIIVCLCIAAAAGSTVLRPRAGAAADPPSAAPAAELKARIFEMRTYFTRDGALPALHERFQTHTNYLFVKHDMTLVGYWTPIGEPNELVYILAYPSREAREASWKSFLEDAEWKRVYAESHEKAGGPIVTKVESVFLEPTDYSPIR